MKRFLHYLSCAILGHFLGISCLQLFFNNAISLKTAIIIVLVSTYLFIEGIPEKKNPDDENILDHNFEDLK